MYVGWPEVITVDGADSLSQVVRQSPPNGGVWVSETKVDSSDLGADVTLRPHLFRRPARLCPAPPTQSLGQCASWQDSPVFFWGVKG